MLQQLIIRNFVLIDELSIDFSSGLTVITGETGAGKSIILGAIGLLMGQRADTSTIRPGADKCIIEAHFSTIDSTMQAILSEEDIESDPEVCIIRREITSKGKSRSFVNDTPASLSLLKKLSEYLIDIHSQHKNLLLGDAHFQLSVLDLYSKNATERATYTATYNHYRQTSRRLEELRQEMSELLKEQDYLQFQFDQIEQAEIGVNELEELQEEERTLSHALDIKMGLGKASDALNHDESGVLRGISYAIDGIQSIRKYYAEAESLYERLYSTKLELVDLSQTIDTSIDWVEYDPQRLAYVNERLDTIQTLLHKHGVDSCEDLLQLHEQMGARLESINSSDEELNRLVIEVDKAKAELLRQAEVLHEQRQASAGVIEEALIESLKELGMPFVQFEIHIAKLEQPTSTGIDQVTFLFSANKEIAPEPVADIASGGEISRLMLSIKALIADRRSLPTIIFDEIDTGVSGDIAERIGFILRGMGRSMQVMAVTHLPQIAAAGAEHFFIYKEHSEHTTRSHIRKLSESERIDEIARMQSGNNLSSITRAAAEELLQKTQQQNPK